MMGPTDAEKDHSSLRRLLTEGVTCLALPLHQQEVSTALFRSFEVALPSLRSSSGGAGAPEPVLTSIPDGSIDAHRVNGYHSAGVLPWSATSNLHREGLVWSRNGDTGAAGVGGSNDTGGNNNNEGPSSRAPPNEEEPDPSDDEVDHFSYWAERMEHMLHGIAIRVLEWIESYLELPAGWFRRNLLGNPNWGDAGGVAANGRDPDCKYYHQWHLKNYVFDAPSLPSASESPSFCNQSSSPSHDHPWEVVLPVHTDPSLVSVVILDRPGTQPGGQGLQYWDRHASQWKEVQVSGHGVAIILIGSVLSRITHGHLHAPKHRVVTPATVSDDASDTQTPLVRRAATMFLRPAPEALLQKPPSRLLMDPISSGQPPSRKDKLDPPITFEEWTSRVSKNYRRKRKPQDKK